MTDIVDLNPGPIEFVELQQGPAGTTANASGLLTTTTTVSVSGSYAPTSGQLLTAIDGTTASWQTPSTVSGDMVLASVQSVTGKKTFDTTKIAVKGSSTGVTTFESANSSATNYTQTFKAATGTIALISDITGINSGTNTGDQVNITGNAATVTTNANLTGAVTSVGNATSLGSFTTTQLNAALSDADVAYKGPADEIVFSPGATPSTPGAGDISIFANSVAQKTAINLIDELGFITTMQASLHDSRISVISSIAGAASISYFNDQPPIISGSSVIYNYAATNKFTRLKKIGMHSLVPSINNIAGFRRASSTLCSVGGSQYDEGGFFFKMAFSLSIGLGNITKRVFAGLTSVLTAPVDVLPSTLLNMIGMGCDDTDTNFQFFNNDGSGTATKTDLGASFPVPFVDETSAYELTMFSPPGSAQQVSYSVKDLISGAIATGTITNNLPSLSTTLSYRAWMGSGQTESVVGIALIQVYLETNY